MSEFVVLLDVSFASHDAAGHGPLVDAEFEHHPDMQAGEGQQIERKTEMLGDWDDEGKCRKPRTGADGAARDKRN